jgi:nucleotide-binding universal stress UspA family protein
MMYEDLLVYLKGGKADAPLLTFAENIAQSQKAFLTGLFCSVIPEMVAGEFDISGATLIQQLRDDAAKEGDASEKELQALFKNLEPLNELRRINAFSSQAANAIAKEARTYDLVIASRSSDQPSHERHVLESLLFNTGRGCLFVPEGKPVDANLDTVLVGWRNTAESAHAVAAAMPFLKAAKKVIVALVIEHGAPEHDGEMPGADIARHLGRHGANVELRQVTGWTSPGAALMNEVEMNDAKLIVMGAYGHSRFRERILGGATEDVLGAAEVPVLMAH